VIPEDEELEDRFNKYCITAFTSKAKAFIAIHRAASSGASPVLDFRETRRTIPSSSPVNELRKKEERKRRGRRRGGGGGKREAKE